MGNTVQLTIEVDDQGTAKVVDFQKKATEAQDAVSDSARKTGDTTAKAGEAGRLGFFALGNAVEGSARSMGVAGQASRQLGNSVERMAASTIPAFGAAIGIATLAVTATVAIWQQFIAAKQKARKEIEESTTKLWGEVQELYKNRDATRDMQRAEYDLLVAKKAMLALKLPDELREEQKELAELQKELKSGPALWDQMRIRRQAYREGGEDWEAAEDRIIEKWEKEKQAAINLQNGIIGITAARIKNSETTPGFSEFTGPKVGADETLQRNRDLQLGLAQANLEFAMTDQNDWQGIYAARSTLDAQYWANKRSMMEAAGAGEDQIEMAHAAWQRSQDAKDKQAMLKNEQMFQNAKMQTIGLALNTLAIFVGNKNKMMFVAQKALAIAQIYVDTGRAAMAAAAAVAGIPIVGPELAAAASAKMWALGNINMALTALGAIGELAGGGGGGGISAPTPTVETNPGTGLPANTQPGSQGSGNTYHVNLTIVNPLSDDNWDAAIEKHLFPAMERAGARNVTVSSNVIRQ